MYENYQKEVAEIRSNFSSSNGKPKQSDGSKEWGEAKDEAPETEDGDGTKVKTE